MKALEDFLIFIFDNLFSDPLNKRLCNAALIVVAIMVIAEIIRYYI